MPPARAMAAYGSPAFYEGRPARDDIAVREVVRHEADGDRVLLEVRFAVHGLGVAGGAGRGRPRRRCRGSPGPRSCWPRVAPAGSCCPTTTPIGCSASGTYRFEEGDAGPGTCDVEVEGDLKVRVPIVGRSVEKVIVGDLRAYIADEVAGIADWEG